MLGLAARGTPGCQLVWQNGVLLTCESDGPSVPSVREADWGDSGSRTHSCHRAELHEESASRWKIKTAKGKDLD